MMTSLPEEYNNGVELSQETAKDDILTSVYNELLKKLGLSIEALSLETVSPDDIIGISNTLITMYGNKVNGVSWGEYMYHDHRTGKLGRWHSLQYVFESDKYIDATNIGSLKKRKDLECLNSTCKNKEKMPVVLYDEEYVVKMIDMLKKHDGMLVVVRNGTAITGIMSGWLTNIDSLINERFIGENVRSTSNLDLDSETCLYISEWGIAGHIAKGSQKYMLLAHYAKTFVEEAIRVYKEANIENVLMWTKVGLPVVSLAESVGMRPITEPKEVILGDRRPFNHLRRTGIIVCKGKFSVFEGNINEIWTSMGSNN